MSLCLSLQGPRDAPELFLIFRSNPWDRVEGTVYRSFRNSRSQLQVSIWPLAFGHEAVWWHRSNNNSNNENNNTWGKIALSDTKGNPFKFFPKLGKCRDYCSFYLSDEKSSLEWGSDLPRTGST